MGKTSKSYLTQFHRSLPKILRLSGKQQLKEDKMQLCQYNIIQHPQWEPDQILLSKETSSILKKKKKKNR